MTENEKIELFDKWYDENYDEWAEGEEGIALREELEQAFKSGIATLEKENAELKEELTKKADTNHSLVEQMADLESENAELKEKYVKNITDCDICDTYCNSQLTKAKEIIREFVEWANWQGNSKCPSFKSIQDKAEQFLSEVEK